ncbi:MAG: sigma-70 family RNA polymerase sigma factor [archaeon]
MYNFSLINYEVPDYKSIDLDFNKLKLKDTKELNKLILKELRLLKRISKINDKINEDLLQEIIIKLITDGVENYDSGKDFTKWVNSISEHVKSNFIRDNSIRKHSSFEKIFGENCRISTNFDIEQEFVNEERNYILSNFISQLKPKYRYILSKYYGFGCEPLTYQEIGERMGYSYEYIRQELEKAKEIIKKRLKWEDFN